MSQVNGQREYRVDAELDALEEFLEAIQHSKDGKICFARENEAAISLWTDGVGDYTITGWSRIQPPSAATIGGITLHCTTEKEELEHSLLHFLNDQHIKMLVITSGAGSSLHLWKKGGDALGVAGLNLKVF